jgi:hypothetical protein
VALNEKPLSNPKKWEGYSSTVVSEELETNSTLDRGC